MIMFSKIFSLYRSCKSFCKVSLHLLIPLLGKNYTGTTKNLLFPSKLKRTFLNEISQNFITRNIYYTNHIKVLCYFQF